GRAGAGGGGSHPPGGGQAAQPLRAFCGLRPRVLQGEVSPCEPLWPAFQLVPRLPNPIEHTRPRGIHAPTRSFGIIQTMLLALANFGLERMARKNSGGYAGMALLSALRAQNQKPKNKNQKPKTKNQKPKTKNQKPKTKKQRKKLFRPQAARTYSGCCGFSRPIRASPQIKKYGSHARMIPGKDRGTGRALRSVGLTGF